MGEVGSKLTSSHVTMCEAPLKRPELRTIPQHLQHYAHTMPDKEAMAFVSTDGGREAITFRDVFENSKKVAHNLIQLGVNHHDVVGINMRTCPQWLYVAFGSMMAGARPCPMAFTYKDGSDLIALMGRLKTCSCLVLDPGFDNENWNILVKLLDSHSSNGSVRSKQMPSLQYLIVYDRSNTLSEVKSFETMMNQRPEVDLPEVQEDDIACLFQTSGSTGMPKLVAHTHRSLLVHTNLDTPVYSVDDVLLNERPFGWIGGFPLTVCSGHSRITLSGFCQPPKDRPSFLIDVVRRERCNHIAAFPSTILKLLERKDELGENWPIKLIATGGQPITKHTVSCMRQLCRYGMISYGGTEAMHISANIVTDPELFVEHSCGRILPGKEVKIVDLEGNTVPINTTGEIFTKGKDLFCGYYNDPEKTAAAFTKDGWYKTDDLGRMLEDGSLIVEGRKSNMIVSGGMNVAPEILEKLMEKCPGVEAVVLVPLPDDVMYQVICACVKVVPGSDVDETVLRKFWEDVHADKLGLFTVLPKFYMFLERFPETISGKVNRKELVDIVEKTFEKMNGVIS